MERGARSTHENVIYVAFRRGTRSAYEHFLEGCRLDVDQATYARAEQAYRNAIALDPALACAHVNLGALRQLAGDAAEAEQLFRQALALDPELPEALHNLGLLLLESARAPEAVTHLQRAIALRPGFADAHFNLATALDRVGRHVDARRHWETYLALSPEGPYAPLARQHLHPVTL